MSDNYLRQTLVIVLCVAIGLFLVISPTFIKLPNEVVISLVLGSLIMVLTSVYYDRKEEPIYFDRDPNDYPRICLDCQKFGKVWGCVQCGALFRQDNEEYLERVRIASIERQNTKSNEQMVKNV